MTQQPGWGPQQPPQPGQPPYGYPQQPGPYGAPPPLPKQGLTPGGLIALGCGGLLVVGGLFVAIAAFSTIGDSSSNASRPTPAASTQAPAAAPPEATPAKEPATEPALKIEAKKTPFTRGILAAPGAHTSVRVTVINSTDETVSVNPLYFTITATDGMKYTHELAADEHQLDAVELAPGEKTTGVVTGKGTFAPAYVTFTDGLFGDPVRVKVS